MDEDNQKGQGGVEDPAGEPVPESKIKAFTKSGTRVHLVGLPGGRQIEEADQRLDEQKEFEKFWASFQEFDR